MSGDLPNIDLDRLAGVSASRAANMVNEICSPMVVGPVVLLAVSLRVSGPLAGLGWAALGALFGVSIPMLGLLALARSGRIMDRHVVVRQERHLPHLIAIGSVITGLLVLVRLGAPLEVTLTLLTSFTGLVAMGLISTRHKTSIHTGVMAGSAVIVTTVFGWVLVPVMAGLVLLVGWARIRSGRHSPSQVLSGAAVGVLSSLVFPVMAG